MKNEDGIEPKAGEIWIDKSNDWQVEIQEVWVGRHNGQVRVQYRNRLNPKSDFLLMADFLKEHKKKA